MGGLYLLLPTLVVIVVSFLVVRVAAIALMMTGMEEQRARFQALSAFSGTGFTTREAEIVINNPRRRSIVTWLMILGNAGIVTVIVSATSSIVTSQGYQIPIAIVILIAAIYLFYRLASNRGLTQSLERLIENRLLKLRAFQDIRTEDLFLVKEPYSLLRVFAVQDSPLIGKSISKAIPKNSDVLVLAIEQNRKWTHFPKPDTIIKNGARLIMYGQLDVLKAKFEKSRK
jgi:Trk K+ transport system NAD-binding subunit